MIKTVRVREWLAVSLMLFVLVTIAASSFATKNSHSHETVSFDVTVIGAVTSPQKITLPVSATVADLLTKIDITSDADLNKLMLEEKLKPNQIVIIPIKGKKSLYITGAVKRPQVICVPDDCTFRDLSQYLSLSETADPKFFSRRRRLLKEGEVIDIPSKQTFIASK